MNFPELWIDTVCTGRPESVLELYLPDAVLVPTYSKKILRGHPELLGYFRRFLSKHGLCGKIESVIQQDLAPRVKVFSGTYRFQWTEKGRPKGARARYTFVLVPVDPRARGWRVAEHHSSEVPDE